MKENNHDIQKLLERFVDAQTAGQMAEDIGRADAMLSAIPAVQVSEQALAAIRGKVRTRLAIRKIHRTRIRIEKFVTAAAAIIVVAVLAGIFFNSLGPIPPIDNPLTASSLWNDTESDPVGVLSGKVETLSTQMDKVDHTAVQWLDENSGLTVEVESLEEVALNTEFWKG